MKYLITGLGNPGPEYLNTRHNIGWQVLDSLIGEFNTKFNDKRYGYFCSVKYKARILALLKPTTYMNLSGRAVNYYLKKEKIPIENLLVIVDDIALPLGTIRIKSKGSSGGHNGLSNIADILGTNDYARMRIGIGGDFKYGKQSDFVLGEWSEHEQIIIKEKFTIACEAVKSFVTIGAERTMNFYNNK